MKRLGILVLFFSTILTSYVLPQQQSMSIIFKSRYYVGHPIRLDSINIFNKNRNCDTILYNPDTILTLYYTVNINESKEKKSNTLLQLSQNFPNPVQYGTTKFTVTIKKHSNLVIQILNVLGNVVATYSNFVSSGKHTFLFHPSKDKVYFIRATTGQFSKTIKLINNPSIFIEKETLEYLNYDKNITYSAKMGNYKSVFWFEPGDTLRCTAYSVTPEFVPGSDVVFVSPQVVTTFVTFHIIEGIPCDEEPAITFLGNIYKTVKIKDRCWLKENLNAGLMILSDVDMSDNGILEKYCYDNDSSNCDEYGGLYQWGELMNYTDSEGTQGICPEGWHIPKIDEFLDMTQGYWGNDFKETGNTHWNPGSHGTNLTGFTALPSGGWVDTLAIYKMIGNDAPFFTSTKLQPPLWGVYFRDFNLTGDMSYGNTHIKDALAVRCIKDQ